LDELTKRKIKNGAGKKSVRQFIENYLWIIDKKQNLVLLKLNRTQKHIMSIIEDLWKRNIPIRLIILKARQEGVSTLIEAIIFTLTIFNKFTKSKIISYNEKSSTEIYQITERFMRNLPKGMQPVTKYYTKQSLDFQDMKNPKNSLDSRIQVDTAKNMWAGKSETIHNLHFSEVSIMEYARTLMVSAMNAVPKTPNTMVVLESTARGQGTYFHKQWKRAEKGEGSFIPIFIPWYWHEEYSMKPTPDFEMTDWEDPTYGNEKEIKKRFELTKAQMYWRRRTIEDECDFDLETFMQEYPSTAEEAFLATGNTRFDKSMLALMTRRATSPIAVGDVNVVESLPDVIRHYGGLVPEVSFSPNPRGNLKIWEYPQEYEIKIVVGKEVKVKNHYVIAVDVSEGIEISDRKTDYCCAHVYKRESPFKLVAELHGKIEPDILGHLVYALGFYYCTAWVGVERNNHGIMTNKVLQNLAYPLLYYRLIIDEKTNKKTKKFGWYTGKIERPLMIDDFASLVRKGEVTIPSIETISEMKSFIRYPNGNVRAESGAWDDRVIASCICYQLHKLLPKVDFSFKPIRRKRRQGSVTGY